MKEDEPQSQLATRIPKDLRRSVKLHCLTHEVTIQVFLVEAIREALRAAVANR